MRIRCFLQNCGPSNIKVIIQECVPTLDSCDNRQVCVQTFPPLSRTNNTHNAWKYGWHVRGDDRSTSGCARHVPHLRRHRFLERRSGAHRCRLLARHLELHGPRVVGRTSDQRRSIATDRLRWTHVLHGLSGLVYGQIPTGP